MVAKDTAMLAKLLEPDTVLVHMTGYVQPVSEWLTQIKTFFEKQATDWVIGKQVASPY